MARTIGVAIIGTGFMGSIHARAHTLVRQVFPEAAAHPELRVVADIDGAGRRTGGLQARHPPLDC